jgi:hypothetical protein
MAAAAPIPAQIHSRTIDQPPQQWDHGRAGGNTEHSEAAQAAANNKQTTAWEATVRTAQTTTA